MKNHSLFFATVTFLFATIAPVQAATIDLDFGAASYTVGGPVIVGTNVDFGHAVNSSGWNNTQTVNLSAGTLTLNNASILSGTDSNEVHAFNHTAPGGTTATYLAVFGPQPDTKPAGNTTFALNSGIDGLGFTWGSVASSDQLTVTRALSGGGTTDYIISGTNLIDLGIAAGTDTYFSFAALTDITKLVFTSLTNAKTFEIAGMAIAAVSNVPLPAAFPLLGLGLVALYGTNRRRKTA